MWSTIDTPSCRATNLDSVRQASFPLPVHGERDRVRGFFELRCEHRNDALGVRQDVVAPDADDAIAQDREKSITLSIGNTVGVLPAIDLDDQIPRAADEIGNVWPNRLLSREFKSAQAAIAYFHPEYPF